MAGRLETFEHSSWLPCAPATAWAWHEHPDALSRLTPPGERVEILERNPAPDGTALGEGALVRLKLRVGPLAFTAEAVHGPCEPGRCFTDELRGGPFAVWRHTHEFTPENVQGVNGTRMTDRIAWRLPLAPLSHWMAGWLVRRRLRRLFRFRHAALARGLART